MGESRHSSATTLCEDSSVGPPGQGVGGSSLAGRKAAKVAAGHYHTVAVASDGTAHVWGEGAFGSPPAGYVGQAPTEVTGKGSLRDRTVVEAAAGRGYTVALAADGTVHTWGRGEDGQLGTGKAEAEQLPVEVSGNGSLAGRTVVKVAAGYRHAAALASDGSVHIWGAAMLRGVGSRRRGRAYVPVEVTRRGSLAGKTIVDVAAGDCHTVVLASDGSVHAWGAWARGAVGAGGARNVRRPVEVSGAGSLAGREVTSVAAGSYHTVALASDGSVHVWGWGSLGALGTGGTSMEPSPVEITASGSLEGTKVVGMAAGGSHTVAFDADGGVHVWGEGKAGRLGTGRLDDEHVPVEITVNGTLRGKVAVGAAAGQHHTAVVASDGTVHVCGRGNGGSDSIPPWGFTLLPVVVDGSG